MRVLARVSDRAMQWLERVTSEARSRHAADLFQTGRPRAFDRVVSRIYFATAVARWAGYEDQDHHLAALRAGLVQCDPPRKALDLGTGTGGAAAAVARAHPTAQVVALDTSTRMLRTARGRHGDLANLEFRRASAARLPFPDATFDLAICMNAVPEPAELGRVLTAEAQVLAVSTTLPVRSVASPWVARWEALGFRRRAAADVEGGSWEQYERVSRGVRTSRHDGAH